MALIDPLVTQLRALPSDELISLRRRIELRFRRAFRQGFGHWVLGILLLAIAAGCLRAFLMLESTHSSEVLNRVDALLGTRHEPAHADLHTGLISAVMTPINRSDSEEDLKCRDADPECAAAAAMHHNFTTLAALALSEKTSRRADVTDTLVAQLKFAEWVPNDEWGPIRTEAMRTLQKVRDALDGKQPFVAVVCKPPKEADPRTSTWGPQGCLPEGEPPQTHMIVPGRAYTSDTRVLSHSRLKRAAWLSELLIPSAAAVAKSVVHSEARDEFRLVQAYFISADSLLRIWTADTFPNNLVSQTGFWASAHYFEIFLSAKEKTYETAAYVDTGGYGVVKTICSAIDSPTQKELIGVFCTDVKLPEDSVAIAIADSPFFDVFRAELSDPPVTTLDIRIERVRPRKVVGAMASDVDLAALKAQVLARAVSDKLSSSEVQLLELPSETTGSRRVFFMPLKSNGDHPTRGLIVAPTTPETPFAAWVLWTTGVASLLGMFLVAASLTRARRAGEYSSRLMVLRNLPVGVVEVNSEDEILLANDRAEEVLGRHLPKAQPSGLKLNFQLDVIEKYVVPVDKNGQRQPYAEKYEQAVQETRRTDEWSSYYACLQGSRWRRWIRVTAVPVLTEGLDLSARTGGTRQPAAFGILEKASQEDEIVLRQLVESAGAITGGRHA